MGKSKNYLRGFRKEAPEMRKVLREAEAAGCKIVVAKKGHVKVFGPDGRLLTVLSITARVGGGYKNFRRLLEKEGIL